MNNTNQTKSKGSAKLIAIIIEISLAILSFIFSVSHYADGGCDGGLCGLGLIVHGIPMLIAYVLLIIATLLYPKYPIIGIIITLFSTVVNSIVLGLGYLGSDRILMQPLVLLLIIQIIVGYVGVMILFNKPKTE